MATRSIAFKQIYAIDAGVLSFDKVPESDRHTYQTTDYISAFELEKILSNTIYR
jgi:hypothetical protein